MEKKVSAFILIVIMLFEIFDVDCMTVRAAERSVFAVEEIVKDTDEEMASPEENGDAVNASADAEETGDTETEGENRQIRDEVVKESFLPDEDIRVESEENNGEDNTEAVIDDQETEEDIGTEEEESEEEWRDANAQEVSDAVVLSIDDRTEDEIVADRSVSVSGLDVVKEARQYVGKLKYVYGGTSLTSGADCSGFLCRIYEKFGINLWKHRTQMYKYRTSLGIDLGTDMDLAQAGDIVVYSGHVGLVTEKKTVINMQSSGCKEPSYKSIASWAGTVRCIIRPYGVSADGNGNMGSDDTPTVPYAAPTIDDVYAANVNFDKGTYDVIAVITAEAGLDRVQFPTWTEANGQDDLMADWATNSNASGTFASLGNNQYKCRFVVRAVDHKNEWGKYITHVYAYDKQGKCVNKACDIVNLSTDLILNKTSISGVNALQGYSLWVEVISIYGISKIEFLTWTDRGGRDDLVTKEGYNFKRVRNVADGTLYSDAYKVSVADHGNSKDIYHNAIKVYEDNGKVSEISLEDVDMRAASSGNCGTEGSDLTWRLTGSGDDLSLYIEGTGDMPDDWLPDDVDQSRNIVPWYASKDKIKHVYLPDGLTSIGSYAFSKTAITQIEIPDSVAVINGEAFLDCPGLSGTLELPSKLKLIGSRAFLGTNYDTLVFHSTGIRVPKYDDCSEMTNASGVNGDFTADFTPLRVESGHTEYCYYNENTDRTYTVYVDQEHFVDETRVTLLYPADGSNPTEYAEFRPWTAEQWNGYKLEAITVDLVDFKLDQYTLELEEGDQKQIRGVLDAEDTASKTITWTSADENVVQVDSQGIVTAVKVGNTVITAKVNGTTQTQECAVFVKAKPTVEIVLNVTDTVLRIGDTLQLTGEVLPSTATNRKFSWYSSDEQIASIDGAGLVTAKAPGSVSIVAQAEDGASYAYCDIKVLPDADSIRLNRTSITLLRGNSQTLLVFLEPEDASGEEFVWSSADESIATVVNGKVTAVGTGTTLITVSEKTKTSVAAYCEVTVNEATVEEKDKELLAGGVIPEGIWIAGFDENKVYTGNAVKQTVRVYNGTELLTEKKDYTLTYRNNKKAALSTDVKAPELILKMRNNFSGKKSLKFNIYKADIGSDSFTAEDLMIYYDGKVHRPIPVLICNGKKLKAESDYVVSYPSISDMGKEAYTDAGTYEAVIQGVGNYTGQRKVTIMITAKKPLNAAVIAKIKNQTYNGTELRPELKVTYKGIGVALQEGVDYNVKYTNNKEVGKATATITAIEGGDYIGSKTVNFNIVSGYSISKAQIINLPGQVPYTGTEQEITGYVLQYDGVPLKEHEDYEVSYLSNINAGKATVIFTGIKNYRGTLKKTYRITPLQADEAFTISGLEGILYMKNGAKPKPIVTFNGQMLCEGIDYTLFYRNNKNVGEIEDVSKQPVVTVKGKGNFTGSTSRNFVIDQQNIGKMTLTIADKAYTVRANKWQSVPTVTDINGKKLKAGKDYEKEVEYSTVDDWNDVPGVGTVIKVTVTGKGAYTGKISGSYHIMKQSVSSAKVVIDPQEYTGGGIEPTKENITVTVGNGKNKVTLTEKDYDILDYQNNIKKGTGYILIRGKGNYGGTKKISFRIGARSVSKWWRNI